MARLLLVAIVTLALLVLLQVVSVAAVNFGAGHTQLLANIPWD